MVFYYKGIGYIYSCLIFSRVYTTITPFLLVFSLKYKSLIWFPASIMPKLYLNYTSSVLGREAGGGVAVSYIPPTYFGYKSSVKSLKNKAFLNV